MFKGANVKNETMILGKDLTPFLWPSNLSHLLSKKVKLLQIVKGLSHLRTRTVSTNFLILEEFLDKWVSKDTFLWLDRQIAFDTSKSCCGNLCHSRFGKANLKGLWHSFLVFNRDTQDIFLISHMQLLKNHIVGPSSMHIEYYLPLSLKSNSVAF